MNPQTPPTNHYSLAYDDVLLVPQFSALLPHETSTTTRFSQRISLQTPLISAAMDTVTESQTAIVMAQLGGIGVIHKNCSVEQQAHMVRAVKQNEHGMVRNPVTVTPQQTLRDIREMLKQLPFTGFPVVEGEKLVGILTRRDMRFEDDPHKLVQAMMTQPVIFAAKGISAPAAAAMMHQHRIEKLPVIDPEQGSLWGMFTLKDILQAERFPLATKDKQGRLVTAAAIGVGADSMARAHALVQEGVDALVVDTAHGHSAGVVNMIRVLKQELRDFDVDIVAGNIATAAAAAALIEAGADGIKVGIGPGSICTTRMIAGVGVPQFTAVRQCAEVARQRNIPLIADGGIKFSGDIVKALAGGADAVMLGSLLAGTDESPGELIIYQGKSYKYYRGMGSLGAMNQGSKDRYAQGHIEEVSKLVPEGVEGQVPYRGPLSNTIHQLVGGLRAGMGYVGAADLNALRERAEFIVMTGNGLRESHTHDVFITRESPNYRRD